MSNGVLVAITHELSEEIYMRVEPIGIGTTDRANEC